MAQDPFVSIVIPWRSPSGEKASLEKCLSACLAQRYPNDSFEVIVVDNNDAPASLGPEFEGKAILVREEATGSYAARNAGVRASRGSILAFTDSDCVPDAEWIRGGAVAVERSKGKSLIGGKVSFSFASDEPNLFELYDSKTFLQQEDNIARRKFASTANLFMARAAFDDVGGFDGKLLSGGDADICRRALEKGFSISYESGAAVAHPARARLGSLVAKTRRIAGGYVSRKQSLVSALARTPAFEERKAALRTLRYLLLACGGAEALRIRLGGKPRRS